MISITLGVIGCDWTLNTHSIDPRQLLGELQKDGNNDGLSVHWRAKKLQDGHLPLHIHLPLLLLHLSQHVAHLLSAGQPPQTCEQEEWEEWELEKMKDGRLNGQSALTSLGLVLLAADDVKEAWALGAERQKWHLKHSRNDSYTQQDWPQVLAAQ